MKTQVTSVSLLQRAPCTLIVFYRNGQKVMTSHRSYLNPSWQTVKYLTQLVNKAINKRACDIAVFSDGWVAIF